MTEIYQSIEEDNAQPTWLFRMCGMHQTLRLPIPASKASAARDDDVMIVDEDGSPMRDLRNALISHFNIEEDANITFHLENEECLVQHALQDLLTVYSAPRVGAGTLQIHLQRHPTPIGSYQNATFQPHISFTSHEQNEVDMDTRKVWKDVTVPMPVYELSIEDFHSALKDVVVQRLDQDAALRRQLDRKYGDGVRYIDEVPASGAWGLQFEAVVHSRRNQNVCVDLAEDHPYIKRLQDFSHLFADPERIIGRTVPITVSVLLARRAGPNFHEEDLTLHDIVRANFSLPPTQQFESLGKLQNDQRRATDRITVRHSLLAHVDDNAKTLEGLYHLPAWNLDNRLIAQRSPTNPLSVPFSTQYKYSPKYAFTKTLSDLETRIFQPPKDLDVPFEPAMSLQSISPPAGPTPTLPWDASIAAVVRICNHVPDFAHLNPTLENLNCQIEILTGEETAFDIADKIHSKLQRRMELSLGLFGETKRNRWKWEIWVMPHRAEDEEYLPNLARFREGMFSQFLVQGRVDAGELKMYLEFHIWPVEAEEVEGL